MGRGDKALMLTEGETDAGQAALVCVRGPSEGLEYSGRGGIPSNQQEVESGICESFMKDGDI